MFNIEFYDSLTKHLFSPWWICLLQGLNFIIIYKTTSLGGVMFNWLSL